MGQMTFGRWTKQINLKGIEHELEIDPHWNNIPGKTPEKFLVFIDEIYFGIMERLAGGWFCSTHKPQDVVDHIGKVIDSFYKLNIKRV